MEDDLESISEPRRAYDLIRKKGENGRPYHCRIECACSTFQFLHHRWPLLSRSIALLHRCTTRSSHSVVVPPHSTFVVDYCEGLKVEGRGASFRPMGSHSGPLIPFLVVQWTTRRGDVQFRAQATAPFSAVSNLKLLTP